MGNSFVRRMAERIVNEPQTDEYRWAQITLDEFAYDTLRLLKTVERYERTLRYMADYQMTGTEMTLHIDFQGKAREALTE